MDAKETVRYLSGLKSYYAEVIEENKGDKGYAELEPFVEALNDAILAVQPPVGAGQMRWIYLPDADLMPYEHLNMISGLADALDKFKFDLHGEGETDDWFDLTTEQAGLLEMALMVYRTVLMDIHKDRIRDGVAAVVKGIGKAQKEGRLDT